jgi:hypothetical protein
MPYTKNVHQDAIADDASYTEPELTLIGDASEVIMGMPGGGFDGAYGMTPPDFEFEVDDRD